VGRAFWAVHAQDCRPSVKYKRVAVREDEVPVIIFKKCRKVPLDGAQGRDESSSRKQAESGGGGLTGRGGGQGHSARYNEYTTENKDKCTSSTTVCTRETAVLLLVNYCHDFRNIENLRSFRIRVRCNMSDPSGTASVSGQSTATVSVGYCCCHGG
jgi:hypothetical protein